MTLIAFLPVLLQLSENVKELPIVGSIAYPLVYAALFWSIFGTILWLSPANYLAWSLKISEWKPPLEKSWFSAVRKPAEPLALRELLDNVRKNYFCIYLHYTYFNLFRNFYQQQSFAYILLIPTIALGTSSGHNEPPIRCYEVTSSFQYLVRSYQPL